MTPVTVQFRFLQVVTSHIADERVTVALLHWDGRDLRIAVNASRVPDSVPSKGDLGSMLRALRVGLLARAKAPALNMSLDQLSPVPLGETGLLSWGTLRTGQTSNPQLHFDHLATALGLEPKAARRERTAEPAFWDFSEQIAHELQRPDRIRAHNVVRGLLTHESPLSWRNAVWHHTFPVDVRAQDAKAFFRKLEKMFGRIDASVPREEIGVVVALHERSEVVLDTLARAEEHIAKNLGGRVEALRAPIVQGHPDFGTIATRIRADVEHV